MYDTAATDEYNIMALFLLQDRVTYRNTIQQRKVILVILTTELSKFCCIDRANVTLVHREY